MWRLPVLYLCLPWSYLGSLKSYCHFYLLVHHKYLAHLSLDLVPFRVFPSPFHIVLFWTNICSLSLACKFVSLCTYLQFRNSEKQKHGLKSDSSHTKRSGSPAFLKLSSRPPPPLVYTKHFRVYQIPLRTHWLKILWLPFLLFLRWSGSPCSWTWPWWSLCWGTQERIS